MGTVVVVAMIWAALFAAWIWLDASPLILGILAICTLPALRDLITNPTAGLVLASDRLRWHSGKHDAEVALDLIDHVRLDTRLDLSVRATVIMQTGRRIRIPFEATPPHQAFEAALNGYDIRTSRHHFSLLQ